MLIEKRMLLGTQRNRKVQREPSCGSRCVAGAGKWEDGKWEEEREDTGREQPALMPPLGHYRRPASNRDGCSQLFQGRFLGTQGRFQGLFPGLLAKDSFQGGYLGSLQKAGLQQGWMLTALSGALSRDIFAGALSRVAFCGLFTRLHFCM